VSAAFGTLYAFFSSFPIVFQRHRGFSPGEGGLAFVGVGLGIIIGTSLTPIQTRIYWKAMDKSETGKAPPEACVFKTKCSCIGVPYDLCRRLYQAMSGGILLPIGLFWFAWYVPLLSRLFIYNVASRTSRTTPPSIHYLAPICAGIPFGTGIAQILQGLNTYLMDTYTIYYASAVAAQVVLRSLCSAAFPLFSPAMFRRLGDQWAMSVFAFLALFCMPLPYLFWVSFSQ